MLGLRRLVALVAGAGSLCFMAPGASAGELNGKRAVEDPTESSTLSLTIPTGIALLQHRKDKLYPGAFAGLGAQFRLSRTFSIGGIGTFAMEPEKNLGAVRLSAEGRYHWVRTRHVDFWGGAEAGVIHAFRESCASAVDDFSFSGDSNCSVSGRWAPQAGIGTGVDLLPIAFFSIGLEARGGAAFHGRRERGLPEGVAPLVYAGLSLSGHIPLGE